MRNGLHYLTDPSHAILHVVYQRLYYAPIIVASFWFGVRGGLLSAFVTSLAYLPHVATAWSGNLPYETSQYTEMVMFYLTGLLVGLLADRLRRLTQQHRAAAESLEKAHRDLLESHQELRQADRLSALGQIAAGLAHEIRNPLAGIKGALEIISSRVQPDSAEAEFSRIAVQDMARLEKLTSEFLAYARPRAPQLRPSDLSEVVDYVVSLLSPEAQRAHVALHVVRDQPMPKVLIDREQMAQVLFDVVSNAVQVSPATAQVVLRERSGPRDAVVEVEDAGPGVAPDDLEHIFEPFFTTKERVTGLGLAISHRIVSVHGGRIEAQRRQPVGTLVRMSLPAVAETGRLTT